MKKNSIASRILFICLIVFPIPFLINLFAISYLSFQNKRERLLSNLKSASNDFNLKIEKTIYLNKLYLTRIADALGFHDDPLIKNPYGHHYFSPILLLSGNLMNLAIISSDGTLIPENENDTFIKFLQNDKALQKNIGSYSGMSSLITIPSDSEPLVYLLTVDNIESAQINGMSGYLLGFKKLDDLKNELFPQSEEQSFRIVLINESGTPLISSDPKLKYQRFPFDKFNLSHTTAITSFMLTGKMQFGCLDNKIPIKNIYTLTFVSKSTFIKEVFKIPLIVLCLFFISFVIIILLLRLLSKRLNNPLNKLSDCMLAVGEGNYHTRFQSQPYGYEINRLGNIFNAALLQLLTSIEKAEKEMLLKQKIDKEISIIKDIQNQLLLAPPHLKITDPKIKIILPQNSTSISNNFFDLTLLSNNHIVGIIGTFSTQGVSACLYSVSIRSLFFTYASICDSVPQIIDRMLLKLNNIGITSHAFNSCLFDYDPCQKTFTAYSIGPMFSVKWIKEDQIRYLEERIPFLCSPQSRILITPETLQNNDHPMQNNRTTSTLSEPIKSDLSDHIVLLIDFA